MGQVQTITMKAFRGMDSFSGELRVMEGSQTRRGVRRQNRRASCNSLRELAGSDAGCGFTAGESEHTSAAHAADHQTDADSAETMVNEAGGTPQSNEKDGIAQENSGVVPPDACDPEKKQWTPLLTLVQGAMQETEALPRDGKEFVEAVNREIYLVGVVKSLLTNDDVKVKHRMCEQLVDIAYGKSSKGAETVRPIIHDLPGPRRD